jgi:hypothetical protein
MERWVKSVEELSNHGKGILDRKNKIDWHFIGGRANVLALGNIDEVCEALAVMIPEHDRLYAEACSSLPVEALHFPRPDWWKSRPINVKVRDRLMGVK